MIALLQQTVRELVVHFRQFVQCFWFGALLYVGTLALVFLGQVTELESLVLLIAIFLLQIVPGAVAWHRHIIAGETVTWAPKIPGLLSFAYALKLVLSVIAFSVILTFVRATVDNLVLPLVGASGSKMDFKTWALLHASFVPLVAQLLFVLVFGTFLLHLPEGALDQSGRGARKAWPPNGRMNFLGALAVIYSLPFVFAGGGMIFAPESAKLVFIYFAVAVVSVALALNLLTVVYRQNMDQLGMSFGRNMPRQDLLL